MLGGLSAAAEVAESFGVLEYLSTAAKAAEVAGVPDLFATASAASKFVSGGAQGINTMSNLSALNTLEGEVSGNQYMIDAINTLKAKNSYYDAVKTMGLALVDGGASLSGGGLKYSLTLLSKGFEPVIEKIIGPIISKRTSDSSEELTTADEKSKLALAVKQTGGLENRYALLGRLYKIAYFTDPDLAEVMMTAANTLPTKPTNYRKRVKDQFKK
ncbi:MAG: hypothetical protein AAF806_11750 [Bacteroidota bacterium]